MKPGGFLFEDQQTINSSTYRPINLSTHQHINPSTYQLTLRLRELETQGLGPSTYRPINHRLFFRFLNEERTEIQFYLFEHTAEQVIENYRQLWQVERTFRITKTDLKIRPIFHFKKRRIETHLSISFVTCKLYKEFGRQLKKKKIGLSAEKGLEETIFGITIKLPFGDEKLMLLDKTFDQKSILEHFR